MKALAGCRCYEINVPDVGQGSSSVCSMPGGITEKSSVLKALSSLLAVYPSAILSSLSFLRLPVLLVRGFFCSVLFVQKAR